MVRRGRVDRGRAVGLSWAEGRFVVEGGNEAAEAVGRPESAAGGVSV